MRKRKFALFGEAAGAPPPKRCDVGGDEQVPAAPAAYAVCSEQAPPLDASSAGVPEGQAALAPAAEWQAACFGDAVPRMQPQEPAWGSLSSEPVPFPGASVVPPPAVSCPDDASDCDSLPPAVLAHLNNPPPLPAVVCPEPAEWRQRQRQRTAAAPPAPPAATPAPTRPPPPGCNVLDVSSPSPADEWACTRCTFLNPAAHTACGICETPRHADASASGTQRRAAPAEAQGAASAPLAPPPLLSASRGRAAPCGGDDGSSTDDDLITSRRRRRPAAGASARAKVACSAPRVVVDAEKSSETGSSDSSESSDSSSSSGGSLSSDATACAGAEDAIMDITDVPLPVPVPHARARARAAPQAPDVIVEESDEGGFQTAFVKRKSSGDVVGMLIGGKRRSAGKDTKAPAASDPLLGLDPDMNDIGLRGRRKPGAKKAATKKSKASGEVMKCSWITVGGRRTLRLANGKTMTGGRAYKYWQEYRAQEGDARGVAEPKAEKPKGKRAKPAAKGGRKSRKADAAAAPDLRAAFDAIAPRGTPARQVDLRPRQGAADRPLPSRAFYDASHEGLPQWNESFMEHEGL